ncbi:MAG TPA: hypothetical protein VL334_15095 [Anaerolineae bacterium]|nr:hypothetical protein [Anaerolineae bacterium]
MAYGEHWEWRAFGQIPHDLYQRILALPPVLPDPWLMEDHYLYAAGCAVNVKLRAGELKLKRFVARDGDLERWLEDPAEVYPFPLTPTDVAETAAALAVTLPARPERTLDQAELLALLRHANPPVQMIVVRKTRHLRTLPLPGVDPDVLLELAEISAPQAILSIALEHPQAEPVRRARTHLGVDQASVTPMSYLRALTFWAQSQPLPVLL